MPCVSVFMKKCMDGIFVGLITGHKRIIRGTNIRKNHVYPGMCLIREPHLE
jgi:hypothetical protein